ncbi:uncharacterized protein LY89DRAFT_689653 [Mollisia scopiformis]|uniref:DUF676 domain-containing protein n=1 Tax=Mollisia scopiformis TaxID=149040 RepID=A0A132BF99_MOLSC|nr:uncharacterized protein LY89DRAFT_689653 [Mollisia scopiformis]KUJ10387.1 hypothetical protein LY89DRAFT_689653 [Mollisia scopiformis]
MPLKLLYDGKGADQSLEPEIDIIAVHGLNPRDKSDDALQSWIRNDHLWLRDSLPKAIPASRIMLYKYDSSQVFNADRSPFIAEATAFLGSLWVKRRECPSRPLLLIGHSLGGILIKQAIVNAHMDTKYEDLRNSIFGLVFMGTPHYGSTSQSKTMFSEACAKIIRTLNTSVADGVLRAIEENSTFSDILQDHWRSKLESYRFISCYGTNDNVVPYEYARQSLSDSRETVIKRTSDHVGICRFDPSDDTDEEEYEELVVNMKSLCEDVLRAGASHLDPFKPMIRST